MFRKIAREVKRIEGQIEGNAPKIESEVKRIGGQIEDNAPRIINDIPVVINAVVNGTSVPKALDEAHNPETVQPLIFSQQPQFVPASNNANPDQNVENNGIKFN